MLQRAGNPFLHLAKHLAPRILRLLWCNGLNRNGQEPHRCKKAVGTPQVALAGSDSTGTKGL